MEDLTEIHQQVLLKMRDTNPSDSPSPAILIWQSLIPLIAVHGFDKILRLVATPMAAPCLQVWPVRIETLTPLQHMQLEDAANALLCMQGGEMTMTRQGIRERGNIVRHRLAFRLVGLPQISALGELRQYRIVEGGEEEGDTMTSRPTTEDESSPTNGRSAVVDAATSADRGSSCSSSMPPGPGRPRVHLRLEDDDNDKRGRNASHQSVSLRGSTTKPINRPHIYLQADDPEFLDLDEEDPDDDLDI
jgi:hypothetical protein